MYMMSMVLYLMVLDEIPKSDDWFGLDYAL